VLEDIAKNARFNAIIETEGEEIDTAKSWVIFELAWQPIPILAPTRPSMSIRQAASVVLRA
jgi:hypothetical protein